MDGSIPIPHTYHLSSSLSTKAFTPLHSHSLLLESARSPFLYHQMLWLVYVHGVVVKVLSAKDNGSNCSTIIDCHYGWVHSCTVHISFQFQSEHGGLDKGVRTHFLVTGTTSGFLVTGTTPGFLVTGTTPGFLVTGLCDIIS